MTARSPALYLSEILSSMDKIERYLAGVTYEEFIRREQLIDAVERMKGRGLAESRGNSGIWHL